MVQLIVGKKGKGKTKALLDHVNAAIKEANGNIVYIDKSSKHMFELSDFSAGFSRRIMIWKICTSTVF